MFSKLSKILLLFAASALLVSCELPLNESPPESKPMDVSLGEATGCLSRVLPVVKTYFEGNAQDAQIEATWNCMATAVQTFEKSVEGRYEDRFTAREVAHFIEQYFLEDNQRIPDGLMTEVFRIKQLFVGGAVESISRTEVKNLNQVIQEMKKITLNLNPYMSVFTMKWDSSALRDLQTNTNHFEDANIAIQQAAKDLATLIEKNGLPYRLEYVTNLLRQMESFNSGGWPWIANVEKAIPLIEKLKKALAGGSEFEIAPNEWHRFALLGARGYIQYLRYHYFMTTSLSAGGNQIFYFTRSIDDLFSFLGDMVDGKPEKMLTRSELLEMLQAVTPLLPKLKVSDELILQVMKIKVVFFGGRVDFFVKADFDRARLKLDAFQELTERFLKYKDVYGFSWKPENMSETQALALFRLAETNLDEFAWRLGANMEDAYDLQNVIGLAEEVEKLYPTTDPNKTSLLVMAQKYVPTVIALKNILFSDHNSIVGDLHSTMSPMAQWSDFLGLAAQGYSRYMQYSYFLQGKSFTQGSSLDIFNQLILKTLDMVDGIIAKKQLGVISFFEFSNLWTAILKTEVLPKEFTVGTLDGLTKVMMQKLLITPEDRLAGNLPNGMAKSTTKLLRSEYAIWSENQKFFNIVYSGISPTVGKPGADVIGDMQAAVPTVGLQELQMIYNAPLTMSFDDVGRLYLSQPPKNYLQKTSDMINLIRAAVRLVVRAYVMDPARIQNYQGISSAEAQNLYTDVKPIAVELGFVHPKNTTFASDRFRDANLFTSVGDGDDYANFRELNHLFLMIISGLKVDSLMYTKMEPVCAVTKPTQYHDDWLTDLPCVIDFYWKEMPGAFASMPDYMAYQATLDKTHYQSIFMNLLKSAGHKETGTGKVHIGDLALVPHVIQYVEGFFQVYDTDRNGILITPEALKAYPTFKTILQQVSGLKSEKELKGLFTWMLKYGKPPQSGLEKIKFATWWVPQGESGWKVEADREKLASILGFIADALNSASGNGGAVDSGANAGTAGGQGNAGGTDTGGTPGADPGGTSGSGAGTDPGTGSGPGTTP